MYDAGVLWMIDGRGPNLCCHHPMRSLLGSERSHCCCPHAFEMKLLIGFRNRARACPGGRAAGFYNFHKVVYRPSWVSDRAPLSRPPPRPITVLSGCRMDPATAADPAAHEEEGKDDGGVVEDDAAKCSPPVNNETGATASSSAVAAQLEDGHLYDLLRRPPEVPRGAGAGNDGDDEGGDDDDDDSVVEIMFNTPSPVMVGSRGGATKKKRLHRPRHPPLALSTTKKLRLDAVDVARPALTTGKTWPEAPPPPLTVDTSHTRGHGSEEEQDGAGVKEEEDEDYFSDARSSQPSRSNSGERMQKLRTTLVNIQQVLTNSNRKMEHLFDGAASTSGSASGSKSAAPPLPLTAAKDDADEVDVCGTSPIKSSAQRRAGVCRCREVDPVPSTSRPSTYHTGGSLRGVHASRLNKTSTTTASSDPAQPGLSGDRPTSETVASTVPVTEQSGSLKEWLKHLDVIGQQVPSPTADWLDHRHQLNHRRALTVVEDDTDDSQGPDLIVDDVANFEEVGEEEEYLPPWQSFRRAVAATRERDMSAYPTWESSVRRQRPAFQTRAQIREDGQRQEEDDRRAKWFNVQPKYPRTTTPRKPQPVETVTAPAMSSPWISTRQMSRSATLDPRAPTNVAGSGDAQQAPSRKHMPPWLRSSSEDSDELVEDSGIPNFNTVTKVGKSKASKNGFLLAKGAGRQAARDAATAGPAIRRGAGRRRRRAKIPGANEHAAAADHRSSDEEEEDEADEAYLRRLLTAVGGPPIAANTNRGQFRRAASDVRVALERDTDEEDAQQECWPPHVSAGTTSRHYLDRHASLGSREISHGIDVDPSDESDATTNRKFWLANVPQSASTKPRLRRVSGQLARSATTAEPQRISFAFDMQLNPMKYQLMHDYHAIEDERENEPGHSYSSFTSPRRSRELARLRREIAEMDSDADDEHMYEQRMRGAGSSTLPTTTSSVTSSSKDSRTAGGVNFVRGSPPHLGGGAAGGRWRRAGPSMGVSSPEQVSPHAYSSRSRLGNTRVSWANPLSPHPRIALTQSSRSPLNLHQSRQPPRAMNEPDDEDNFQYGRSLAPPRRAIKKSGTRIVSGSLPKTGERPPGSEQPQRRFARLGYYTGSSDESEDSDAFWDSHPVAKSPLPVSSRAAVAGRQLRSPPNRRSLWTQPAQRVHFHPSSVEEAPSAVSRIRSLYEWMSDGDGADEHDSDLLQVPPPSRSSPASFSDLDAPEVFFTSIAGPSSQQSGQPRMSVSKPTYMELDSDSSDGREFDLPGSSLRVEMFSDVQSRNQSCGCGQEQRTESPDPVLRVQQVEADEEFARQLQAQFDTEVSRPHSTTATAGSNTSSSSTNTPERGAPSSPSRSPTTRLNSFRRTYRPPVPSPTLAGYGRPRPSLVGPGMSPMLQAYNHAVVQASAARHGQGSRSGGRETASPTMGSFLRMFWGMEHERGHAAPDLDVAQVESDGEIETVSGPRPRLAHNRGAAASRRVLLGNPFSSDSDPDGLAALVLSEDEQHSTAARVRRIGQAGGPGVRRRSPRGLRNRLGVERMRPPMRNRSYEELLAFVDTLGTVPRGLSRAQINALPVRQWSTSASCSGGGATSRANTEADVPECNICMSEYEAGHLLRILPCCHEFHTDCIDKWLKEKNTCPVCRYQI